MDQQLIERFAIKAAKGNNGGEWATHYTEEQKEHWRQFVRDLISALAPVAGNGGDHPSIARTAEAQALLRESE